MDTSMSALAPFKPELIEELVVVRAHSRTHHNADLDLPTRALLALSSMLSWGGGNLYGKCHHEFWSGEILSIY
jgi:hypothetical protein